MNLFNNPKSAREYFEIYYKKHFNKLITQITLKKRITVKNYLRIMRFTEIKVAFL